MNDYINALFEFIGALMLARNCLFLYRSKQFSGVSIASTAFFSFWGIWNLYLYPSVDLMWSFYAGCLLAFFNSIWCFQMIYYKRKNK